MFESQEDGGRPKQRYEASDLQEQYMLREGREGRWWVWDRVHQRQVGPSRTLEEADLVVEELNAEAA